MVNEDSRSLCDLCGQGRSNYKKMHGSAKYRADMDISAGAVIMEHIKTDIDVDAILNAEALNLHNVDLEDSFIFGWRDCGTLANQWMKHAAELQQQKHPKAPATGFQLYFL